MSAQLAGPEELSDDERAAVESLLRRLADDELVLAERYTEWQVRSPTLESDLAISNIAQDELGHARLWYDLLEDFGYTESELIFERDPADFRHSTLVEGAFETGDWADAIVRGYLYDVAEELRLEALEGTSYPRIADRVAKVLSEENYHREHSQNWLERLTSDDEGTERVQAAVDRLFPYALTLFEAGDASEDIDEFGIRTDSLDSMRDQWLDVVVPFLTSLGIELPTEVEDGDIDALLPEHIGRDGTHTDDWADLHDEMTRTYRELGRTETHRIMPDPDDE
ncbi:1,2-phenylacetyl-CoA epoxidase subunit PaaC [Haladaptatus sp. AB643]|uniref:1,2-phenylacetyl-CoA epoxidase subunit PaaC n=1 Tax=Haladaptatus sp. AB643 TaxID=2934174 RepID=UPI00209C6740|nr:1,2-phenylacetyl-CoA epoxidase subunit PaaC [Haladaptatus sp. AB643]MCO8244210.1 phenylacetate-CoA oxygenase subunit PaaC [Haladaptatus sp. AB643]